MTTFFVEKICDRIMFVKKRGDRQDEKDIYIFDAPVTEGER